MSRDSEIAKKFIEEEFSESMKQSLVDFEANNRDELIDYVIKNKAWNDTIIYERMKKKSQILKKRDDVCEALIKEIRKLNNSSRFQLWHKSTLERLAKDFFEANYGMAQKFLNMSIKYIYFLELAYGITLIDKLSFGVFKEDFDVPIDSFILKWLIYNSVEDQEFFERAEEITSWNKMKNSIYPFVQKKAKELFKERYGECGSVLIAETLVWSGIKRLKSEIHMEL